MPSARLRGPGHSVLEAAQVGGDPLRSKAINIIRAHAPRGKRVANNHLHIGSQRSSAERALKNPSVMARHAQKQHVHVLHGKFNRKPRNAVKSHMMVYANKA